MREPNFEVRSSRTGLLLVGTLLRREQGAGETTYFVDVVGPLSSETPIIYMVTIKREKQETRGHGGQV